MVACLSQASVDPAGNVPQPGLSGPSWYGASARPRRTQLVLCLSQAPPDPAGIVRQPGLTGPSWECASARPPGPSWSASVAQLFNCSCPLQCLSLWLHSQSVWHCGCTLTVSVTVVVLLQASTVTVLSVLTVVALFTVAVTESVTGPASGPELVIA